MTFMKDNKKKSLTLKTLNKSNVWETDVNEVLCMLKQAEKDADMSENIRHYITVIKGAYDMEEVVTDHPKVIEKYEERGYTIGEIRTSESARSKWALKKRPIMRVNDLTYENITHISAEKLVEVLERNFGGGWESLSQSIQDIIQRGFDVSTTTLPADRLHKPGGTYEKKLNDGYCVLEIPKGTWTEAIFVKAKPEEEKVVAKNDDVKKYNDEDFDDEENDEDEDVEVRDDYKSYDESEDDEFFDDDKLTEESYRTTFDTSSEDLDLEAGNIAEEEY